MPGSGASDGADPAPEGRAGIEAELAELESAVGRLAEAYRDLRERVEDAEASRRRLGEALEGADLEEMTPGEAAARFEELTEENRDLRERLEEGRERAERIRSRLIMMEDEL